MRTVHDSKEPSDRNDPTAEGLEPVRAVRAVRRPGNSPHFDGGPAEWAEM